MKNALCQLSSRVAALAFCAVMVLSVCAASYEMDYLFAENLHENEWLLREVETSHSESEYGDRYNRPSRDEDSTDYVETEFVSRKATSSFHVDKDATISEFVQVVVPEGKTITIDADITLKIYGQLLVQGKLINKGTLIIGDQRASSRYDDYKTDPGNSQLVVMGQLSNSGNVNILNGKLENAGDATSTNNGTITISNQHERLVGLANSTIKRSSNKIYGGHFVNNGTINVCNDGGNGIRNFTGALFENNGVIAMTQTASIRGTVSGNRPVLKKS